jgi:hypothetical protein
MPPRRHLNLFAIPPETNALFSMLILASIMLALFLGNVFRIYSGRDPLDSMDITARGAELTRAVLPIIGLSGTAAIGVLCLAFLFYLRHPSQIRQRRKLQRLSQKDQGIQEYASQLALQVGLDPPVIEMPVRGLRGSDAQAFGVGRVQSIALDSGFRVLRKTKPEVFKALLHHELAHFANADIGRSYFSDALWRSIRWLLVFPFLLAVTGNVITRLLVGIFQRDLSEVFVFSIPIAFRLFLQWGFVFSIAGTIWARLLRTREFYADWRAGVWGSRDGLHKILLEETERAESKTRFPLWKFHPDPKERLAALQRPEILFRWSSTILFLAGVLLSFIFAGIYFSFAGFLAFGGTILSIRASASGLFYWGLTGIWWAGFVLLIFLIFGLTGWLINAVLLPQLQKQTILELINKRNGWIQYAKMGIPAFILMAGIELGFFMIPFGQLAPNDFLGILLEFFVILPVLTCLAWWYLAYMRFVTLRLLATQTGRNFSVWRSRFVTVASSVWIFLFFIPGVFLTRFLDGGFQELFTYLSAGWLTFVFLFSPLIFGASWILIKLFFENRSKRCPHCGKNTGHAAPAVEFCEHCGRTLGEWLFIPEQS